MKDKNVQAASVFLDVGRKTLHQEAEALAELPDALNQSFVEAGELILQASGRVVTMGLGKSGLIAAKIAATLSSTGTPAFFVHPNDAVHGDLGMIQEQDVVLLLSKSGTSAELDLLLPALKRRTQQLIALTCNAESPLARQAQVPWTIPVTAEACPMDLAPTSSTTAMLACGDALAIALLDARGFTQKNFAMTHPAGQLGRRLISIAGDYMRTGDAVPKITRDASLQDALLVMSAKQLGMVLICEDDTCIGVFTDGDLRRSLQQEYNIKDTPIGQLMTKEYKSCHSSDSAWSVAQAMTEMRITAMVVMSEQSHTTAEGIVTINDLRAGGIL